MNKNILIVEDEAPLQEAIKTKLEKNNFTVTTAQSASQAYKSLKKLKKIDAVWLDHYLLGKEDGLSIVTTIKNNKNYKEIPIFVVSNTASPEKLKTYINLGVEKYYIKSNCRLDTIIKDIDRYLEEVKK